MKSLCRHSMHITNICPYRDSSSLWNLLVKKMGLWMPWSVAGGSLLEDFSQSQPCKWHLGAPSRIHPHNWHIPTPTILCPNCTFYKYLLTFTNKITPRALILESKIFLNRIPLTLATSSQALTPHRLEPKSRVCHYGVNKAREFSQSLVLSIVENRWNSSVHCTPWWHHPWHYPPTLTCFPVAVTPI